MRQLFLSARFLAAVAALAALTACGGAVDDGAPSPSPSPATNAPSSVTNGDGCTQACNRLTNTCNALHDPQCVEQCNSDFESTDQMARYAACIDAVSCEDLRRGMTMNFGPIGECWTRARRP